MNVPSFAADIRSKVPRKEQPLLIIAAARQRSGGLKKIDPNLDIFAAASAGRNYHGRTNLRHASLLIAKRMLRQGIAPELSTLMDRKD